MMSKSKKAGEEMTGESKVSDGINCGKCQERVRAGAYGGEDGVWDIPELISKRIILFTSFVVIPLTLLRIFGIL